ncbi:hypothetical protein A3B45_01430 [Candidatus Daviesbacteria bacterium RIFCSPLOWO2_01_FULL_39_12]|uniref:Nudix hydrolase domain-containing protein n=1 Tax=Candidatus Daviesbacteria bacterium RIFCSPLOWO2_01_FULL_39_12 TaxID=1797785 RepID=A0A1F5KQS1_9BACT|nr:MAG: hypothetical protein A3B45_01430 [Candidatus Daviesbacteria bacterium RIFCSPLOWO2_01_FULL_39_12]
MINCIFENGSKTSLRHVVVHAIVEKDGKLLLEKRAPELLEGEKWSLPSGFLGRDETAGKGVLRELKEETGWTGEIVSLFRINTKPDRPHEDRQNIAIEFIIKPLEQVNKPDKESTEIEWISIDDLPPFNEFAFDHGESIELYLKYKQNPYALSLIA